MATNLEGILSENLRIIIAKRGLGVGEVSKLSGISRKRIYDYLNRIHLPSLENLSKLSRALKTNSDFLCGFSTDDAETFSKSKDFFDELNNLLKVIREQKKLAQKLKVSEALIVKWKNGATPSLKIFVNFCQLVDAKITDFI